MKIGSFDLEKDGVYIIAEMSANHNGSLQTAIDTIKAAKDAGVNAVKLQTYTADTLTLDCHEDDFIVKGSNLWDGENLYDLYKKAYTPWQWHKDLFAYAKEIGIDIFSTPFDKSAVDFLKQFDPPAYKIASYEITDYDLIEYTAKQGKPIIISTGIALENEISEVVEICKKVGNEQIILLKCTSEYPAPLKDANLLTIPDLNSRFDVIAGFSDHTLGSVAPITAVALGAKVIEKHFIIDKSIGGADSEFSMNAIEFKDMVEKVRQTEQLLGKVDYSMTPSKQNSRNYARSIYVAKDIKKGERFTEQNLRSVRPGYGMHPKFLKDILGSVAQKNYKFGERFEK
ncbi:pseudaminic acid synthase [Sulfurimonas sp.]|uniref:pseudaminic acid synthase n=1 Tax=Sulfurimonas sp. TaxID=2022749 RepID=UPI003D1308B1